MSRYTVKAGPKMRKFTSQEYGCMEVAKKAALAFQNKQALLVVNFETRKGQAGFQ